MDLKHRKWKFSEQKLKKGDLLFTRSKLVGDSIAKATKGDFGHVMLYLGNTVIHADTNGVWSKNTQRILVRDPSRLAAYRLKKPLSQEQLEKIENFARNKVGSIYSIPEATQSVPFLRRKKLKRVHRNQSDRQFCSRLVAQSFSDAQIYLVDNVDYCTPVDIAQSNLLEEIPDAVVQANDEEIAFYKTKDPNLKLQKATYSWLNKVRDLAEENKLGTVSTQAEVTLFLCKNPQFDNVVCDYINATEYVSLYDFDKVKNPWRYDGKKMLEHLYNKCYNNYYNNNIIYNIDYSYYSLCFAKQFIDFETNLCEPQMRRIFEELAKMDVNYENKKLEYFKLEIDLFIKRLELEIQHKRAILYVLTRLNVGA